MGPCPRQPALPGKVDTRQADEAHVGNQAGMLRPSRQTEGFLFSASAIDPSTLQAYLETEYQVHGEPWFTLRVNQVSGDLLAAHKQQKTDCSAFLTACNPFSQPFDAAANEVRQAALAQELSHRSLVFWPGIGQHPSNEWPGETSFLVFGLTLEAAKVLATRFEQNAFVWNGSDALAQLIFLR
jgi:hypothetical protein